jgi:CRISPR-associated endonuclease Csy4
MVMKYYIEITLLPNADIALYFLWQKVYQQIHLGLAGIKSEDNTVPVGVSFPQYDGKKYQLGSKLRLFSQESATLESVNISKWLNRLLDYIHITSVREVPANVDSFAIFKRQQVKSSNERLARRTAKWKGISFEQALNDLKTPENSRSKAPFINMQSQSSNRKFRLFILKQVIDQPQEGCYSCYGLSNQTTVPIF